jgi:biopolymer transport protein TolR
MQDFDPEEDAITGINVTPLVDITLVLLIIFMVTARFIAEPSIGVNLPKTSEKGGGQASDNNVFLTINEKREIFLMNKPVPEGQLAGQIRNLIHEKPNMNLVLRADKNVPHGYVIEILDLVRNEGVTQFGIAVEGQMK